MQFSFVGMNEAYAHAIAGWHYEGMYAFYDMDQDPQDLAELLAPASWPGHYFAVLSDDALVGFFCLSKQADAIEIGLGLRPDCTGKGLGQSFVAAGVEFARQKYHAAELRLTVATFNRKAIGLYQALGFVPDGTFMNETNGGQYEFLRMVKRL